MRAIKTHVVLAIVASTGLLTLAAGWLFSSTILAIIGLLAAGYVATHVAVWRVRRRSKLLAAPQPTTPPPVAPPPKPIDPNDPDALVEQMIAQGRFALLLRPQVADNLGDGQLERAVEALKEAMALVPDGAVALGEDVEPPDDEVDENEYLPVSQAPLVQVARFFLDRYPVTNRQFYEFVASGGYQEIALWDESIWPQILDFVDQTGEPGPRFWKDGCYEPGRENHPVVGVSWHEASAYARWVGKRLPSDAEWVKAGSWPANLAGKASLQRKYPWGGTMDRQRANLWGSGPEDTVAVEEFPGGVSVGGVYHLVGNVWEWTLGNFPAGNVSPRDLIVDVPMKSIRGGAYDTYFESQATCQFQSGEAAVSRKRNVGFRCAVGVCDLVLARSATRAEADQPESRTVEEVQV